MDWKSTLLGIGLLSFAFILLSLNVRQEHQRGVEGKTKNETGPTLSDREMLSQPVGQQRTDALIFTPSEPTPPTELEATPAIDTQPAVLANAFIQATFTRYGAGIQEVALLKYPAVKGESAPYSFRSNPEAPILGLSYSRDGLSLDAFAPEYTIVKQTERAISFRHEIQPGVAILRHYRLSEESRGAAPYVIEHRIEFINNSQSNFDSKRLYIHVGAAVPTEADPRGQYLNFGYYDGDKAHFTNLHEFKASAGVLGIGRRVAREAISATQSVVWASVKNQFFTTVLTPAIPARGYHTQPLLLPDSEVGKNSVEGVSGSLFFTPGQLVAGTRQTWDMACYVGPKEYPRLNKLEQRQHLIMQFGWFSLFSQWLLLALIGIKGLVGNYGLAIIIMTVIIRLLLWPLTAQSARAARRMSELQKPLQALREKYQGKPERLRKETAKLFKEQRVNPAAGCLPILVQIPIFLAFFYMLRTASELRFAEFLWIKDLSQPENLLDWGVELPIMGSYLNILPLLMGGSMLYLMRMTPTTLDSIQQHMIQYVLPIIFTIVCYTFSSGLVLYWTVSNLLSITQQKITRGNQAKGDTTGPLPQPKQTIAPKSLSGKTTHSRTKRRPVKKDAH